MLACLCFRSRMTPEQHNLVAKTPQLVTSEEKTVKEESSGESPASFVDVLVRHRTHFPSRIKNI